MKKYRWFFLLAILGLLFTSVVTSFSPAVDAGVGNTRSGGSSRSGSGGSSRSYSGGGSRSSYSSSSSGGGSFIFFGPSGSIVMIVVIGLWIWRSYTSSSQSESDRSSRTSSSWGSSQPYLGSDRPIQQNYGAIRQLKELDPAFDEDAFLNWVREVYLELQKAWQKKDWNSVRSLESASLYRQHSSQLEEYIQNHTTNRLERVSVLQVKIKNFDPQPDGNDRLTIILSSVLRDYIVDDETGKVLEGNPREDLFTVYQMDFIRQHGAVTKLGAQDQVLSDHCPNCGAPLTIQSVGKCEYCGSSLTRSPGAWVLDRYDVVDEDEFYN